MNPITSSLIRAVAVTVVAVAPVLAQDDYLAGKPIAVIVPFSPGGATFVPAKFVKSCFEKLYLPDLSCVHEVRLFRV